MTSAVETSSVETPPVEEAPPVARRTLASKLMLAMAVLLAVALAGSILALWRETQPREMLTGSIEDSEPVDPQTTYSYTYQLAKLVEPRCGVTPTDHMHAASEGEIAADPATERRALAAAQRRAATITTVQSCDYVFSEIQQVELRARGLAKPEH